MTDKLPLDPIFNRVVLKRDMKKATNLVLTEDMKKGLASPTGTILACGHTCDDEVMNLKGEKIMITTFGGEWLTFPGFEDQEFYICNDTDILGKCNY